MAFTNAVAGILTICLSVCASFYLIFLCSVLFLVCFVLWNYCKTNWSVVSLSLINSFRAFLWLCIWILEANGFFRWGWARVRSARAHAFHCAIWLAFSQIYCHHHCVRENVCSEMRQKYIYIHICYGNQTECVRFVALQPNIVQHNTTQPSTRQCNAIRQNTTRIYTLYFSVMLTKSRPNDISFSMIHYLLQLTQLKRQVSQSVRKWRWTSCKTHRMRIYMYFVLSKLLSTSHASKCW